MTPLYRRFLWRTVYGDTWRALGTLARKPDGRTVITTCRGTRIENVHLDADPGRSLPAGNYLRVFGPLGDVWSVGPILSARSLPAPDLSLQRGAEDIGPVASTENDRYVPPPGTEGRDGAFLPAWNAARDIDTVVWTPDNISVEIDEDLAEGQQSESSYDRMMRRFEERERGETCPVCGGRMHWEPGDDYPDEWVCDRCSRLRDLKS